MKDFSSLINELNTLPKGYISKKIIHGDEYFYLQYLENGKIHSKYLNKDRVIEVKKQLERRREIEKYLANLGKPIANIDKNSKDLTGFIMMEDEKVASFDKGNLTWMDEDKVPLVIKRTNRMEPFLKIRSIDTSRTNSRILKRVLRIRKVEDERLALYAHAVTLTDNYWFKPKGSRLKYKDVCFDNDIYSQVALKGEILYYPRQSKLTPELTLTGSFEKCWKKEGDKWVMYKSGSKREIFSEVLASRLAESMNIPTAKYEIDGDYIKTENFANKENFEPIVSIAGSDDSYDNVFDSLKMYGEEILRQYLLLMWFDAIINNIDRHNENLGLMRDRKTGKVISLAPNFDNNLSLIARNDILNQNGSKDGLIKLFVNFIRKNKAAHKLMKSIQFPELNENIIDKCLEGLEIDFDLKTLKQFILNRYKYLENIICNL